MKRVLFALAAAALLGSCEPTTYGQAIQQQKQMEGTGGSGNPDALPSCPTIAREGTADYERCETLLEREPASEIDGAVRDKNAD